MKVSIFFCLLPFTWSVPPHLQSSNNFVFRIPEEEPSLNIWSISEELPEPTKIQFVAPENVSFNSHHTYIILEVQIRFHNEERMCQAFYWIGTDTTQALREHTAALVPLLIYELGEQLNYNYNLMTLSRERKNEESSQFRSIFLMDVYLSPYLYKVTGSMGQYIIEVPWLYSELNGTDSFLFHKDVFVCIWNADPIRNADKNDVALALANRISKIDRCGLHTHVDVGEESSPHFNTFKEHFFAFMEDLTSFDFPEDPYLISDNEIQRSRNEELKLFEFYSENNIIVCSEIDNRPLTLDQFKSDHTYVMLDHYVGNVFIYIGKFANSNIIRIAMSDAEYYNLHMNVKTQNGSWRKVTLIREDYLLPAHFIVNFPEKVNNLKYYEL